MGGKLKRGIGVTRITLDHLDPELERFIAERSARSGVTPDQVILDLLRRAAQQESPTNGPIGTRLDHLAGDWSEEERRQFEAAVAVFNQIDDEMWR